MLTQWHIDTLLRGTSEIPTTSIIDAKMKVMGNLDQWGHYTLKNRGFEDSKNVGFINMSLGCTLTLPGY